MFQLFCICLVCSVYMCYVNVKFFFLFRCMARLRLLLIQMSE